MHNSNLDRDYILPVNQARNIAARWYGQVVLVNRYAVVGRIAGIA